MNSCCRSATQLCLQLHGLQHTRLPCPSPSPGACLLTSIELVVPSNHLVLCCPLLLVPSVFTSIRVFLNELTLRIRGLKYWNFSISPSNEYSGLSSFRIDWLQLPSVQGTLESSPVPQFKSISSLALSIFYGPALTSVSDYWKNHSFDFMDLHQQSGISAF